MKDKTYCQYIDMSGNLKHPHEDVYIGCVLMNERFNASFREQFYRNFPSLQGFNKKGSSLHHDKLKEIIAFMDSKRIKMSCAILKRHIIKQTNHQVHMRIHEAKHIPLKYVTIKSYHERVVACAYHKALQSHAYISYPYHCFSCMETQFNIQETFVAINRLAYSSNHRFRLSCAPRRTEHMIKFADFVASATRKVDRFILNNYRNLVIEEVIPTPEQIDKVFCISRREGTLRKL